jgi:NADPH:quinone reductase-like Zn-dependent oxidoreductase
MAAVPATYKAYAYESYGSVDELVKIREVPTEPLPAQRVRIQVHSAGLNPVDYKLVGGGGVLTGGTPTADKPYRMGFDVAGTIVQVGPGVHPRHLKVGDQVYAMTSFTACGTVAEYVEIDQQYVALKPTNLDFDQAASVPLVALTSYQAFHEYTQLGRSGSSQRVLIIGGSGATGMYAIQFAKLAGAHVIVTGSTKNEELLKSLGADTVIDYRTQKWVDVIEPHSIDIVYDCGFEPNAWNDGAQTVLKKETGEYLTLLGVKNPIASQFGATNHGGVLVFPSGLDLQKIAKLFEAGKLKAIVDSVVPFEKALEGLARVQSRHALGKVVVKVL